MIGFFFTSCKPWRWSSVCMLDQGSVLWQRWSLFFFNKWSNCSDLQGVNHETYFHDLFCVFFLEAMNPLWKPRSKIFTYKCSVTPTVKACQTWRKVLCNFWVNHSFCKGPHFCAPVQDCKTKKLTKEGWLSVSTVKNWNCTFTNICCLGGLYYFVTHIRQKTEWGSKT